MRAIIRIFGTSLFIAVLALTWASAVQAQSSPRTLTTEEENRIKANCVSLKGTVTQLHATDALLRVNRGQIYESMATNLMDRFNARLGSNSLDNKGMVSVTGSYRSALDTFRADYIAYEQKVAQALRINCEAEPAAFFNALQSARELRTKVHDDVTKLHALIDDYRSSVGDFLVNYERISE
jgi:hypothetical protein